MAKIPKFNDLSAAMPGVMNKFKSMLDSLGGPATSEASEAALAQESDPYKRSLLEIELLIKQVQDVQIIQNKTLEALRVRYYDLHQRLLSELAPTEEQTTEVGTSEVNLGEKPVDTTKTIKTEAKEENKSGIN